jgi:hypothetical protein
LVPKKIHRYSLEKVQAVIPRAGAGFFEIAFARVRGLAITP